MSIQLPFIQTLYDDPQVMRIMIDGWRRVYVEINDHFEDVPTPFQNENDLVALIQAMAKTTVIPMDEKKPLASLRLPDGTRVDVALPPVSLVGPAVTIMKVNPKQVTLEDLLRLGTLTQPAADFLKACVEGRVNIAISGCTASGKSTLLKIMARWIPIDERILFLQQLGEASLPHPRLITLETRPPDPEGQGEVTMLDLVQSALRMRPDRILVEEILGAETCELVNAMNRGHDGCLFTLNSNGPRDTLARLERLVGLGDPEFPLFALRERISAAVDLIVHLERIRDGSRKVVEITEVAGMENGVITLTDIFLFEFRGYEAGSVIGSLRSTGLIPKFLDTLSSAGVQVPLSLFAGK
jgi:pilus assembly protein CpaF